jgi:hypothetical protein
MSIQHLASNAAPVLSATLLMNPPASQYRPSRGQHTLRPPVPKRPRRNWRTLLKATVRPLVPVRYRSRVRLVLVASNALPKPASLATAGHDKHDRKAA